MENTKVNTGSVTYKSDKLMNQGFKRTPEQCKVKTSSVARDNSNVSRGEGAGDGSPQKLGTVFNYDGNNFNLVQCISLKYQP